MFVWLIFCDLFEPHEHIFETFTAADEYMKQNFPQVEYLDYRVRVKAVEA